MEAPDVLRMAGCEAPTKEEYAQTKLAAEEQLELERLQKEMTAWRSTRETEIDRYVPPCMLQVMVLMYLGSAVKKPKEGG